MRDLAHVESIGSANAVMVKHLISIVWLGFFQQDVLVLYHILAAGS